MELIEKTVYVADDGTEFLSEKECVEYEATACPIVESTIYLHSDKESQYSEGTELGLTKEALKTYAYVAYEVTLTVKVNRLTGETVCTALNKQPLVEPIKL